MAAGVVHIPWYATLFRGDKFETALLEIAPVAVRYGGTEWEIYRSQGRRSTSSCSWRRSRTRPPSRRYWYGEEFIDWRGRYSSWYQVPVLYAWQDLVGRGGLAAPHEVEA